MWFRLTPGFMILYVTLSVVAGLLGWKLRGGFLVFFVLSLVFTPVVALVLMAICMPVTEPVRERRRVVEQIPPRMTRGRKNNIFHGGEEMQATMEFRAREEGRYVIHKYTWWSAASGLFPLPGIDIVLISGTNLLMIRELTKLYGVPYHKEIVKSLMASIVAGSVPSTLAGVAGWSRFLRVVPFVGQTLVPFGTSVFAGATTYALGGVFLRHFENGGTLVDLNPASVREYFRERFRRGKEKVGAAEETHEEAPATA